MSDRFLLYGANGYTGSLIAHYCLQRGLHPLLAGRNSQQVGTLALSLGLEYKAFSLEDTTAMDCGTTGCSSSTPYWGKLPERSRPELLND